jgi:hypothetical protein
MVVVRKPDDANRLALEMLKDGERHRAGGGRKTQHLRGIT